jgi:predicted TIM-barrel fold metal-dependent hydrolase
MTAPHRIDTHTHIVPPDYGAWLRRRGVEAGGLPIPDWSVDAALAVMDERKVRTSIVSVSTPGVHFGDDHEARDMARAVNEYAAKLARKHPDRFGFFATLTLPDVEGSLAELAYAFDTLKADGVVLLANTHGEYLGAEAQAPLFDELNRRSAAVFLHPAQLPGPAAPGIPPYAVDFLLDTTRAATRLVQSGTMKRCPNIKVILSHAGGFVPYAAHRIAVTTSPADVRGGLAQLKRFYYDVALSSSPAALPSLLAFAQPDHVLFGSDWPHAPRQVGGLFESMYESYPLSEVQRASIDRGAAERLLPRFATAPAR